jgi:exopolyphosphatase / guanosine-5'-triphosphate,3'-diphosphate pyrophosphatase
MDMRNAVIDVGSNTIRLLVAQARGDTLDLALNERVRVGLGEDIERDGRIGPERLAAAANAVRRLSRLAQKEGAASIDVVVTSPGRQAANADELVAALEAASRATVRRLSAEDEGRLAYIGAVAAAGPIFGLVAVCDMGGASTELAVGVPGRDPSWMRSVDLGAVRLTTRCGLGEKPGEEALAAARAEVETAFWGFLPPLPTVALAVGGSARALRRLVGDALGPEELEEAVLLLSTKSHRTLTRKHGVDRRRLRVLLAGALIMSEIQRRVVTPLTVASAGLREGALLTQIERLAA